MFYHREYGRYFSTPQEVTAYLKEKKLSTMRTDATLP